MELIALVIAALVVWWVSSDHKKHKRFRRPEDPDDSIANKAADIDAGIAGLFTYLSIKSIGKMLKGPDEENKD
jgi:hypothetical protein